VERAAEQVAELGDNRRHDAQVTRVELPFENGDVRLLADPLR
jgi:hypothetical protein